ncbi:response regulator [Zooshikella harenae]|uniref:Response regulator n=1 Tax=Zooshikella harenae TaxID=2827238 RepID=A0ABS5ZK11_9GAMM|nr:response regulator [Zooshikella harenae]MBU2713565.1 response regulator [Zooshikella harenae]
MRVLLVEDDSMLADGLCDALQLSGYTVDWLAQGQPVLSSLRHQAFAGVVLDLGLPDMDGIHVIKQIRQAKIDLPILILTARDEIDDRVHGLDAGADDYLVKPFDVEELKARLRALLRRSQGRQDNTIVLGDIALHPEKHQVYYQAQEIKLSRHEFKLLMILLGRPGKVFTKEILQELVYGWDNPPESNSIEVHIHHLRKKFYTSLIKTIRGVGYCVEKVPA